LKPKVNFIFSDLGKTVDNSLALQCEIVVLPSVLYFTTEMIGRRFYRIKVLLALYAWFQGGEHRMDVAEKNILHGIDKFYELYFLLFSFFIEITDFYRRRTEDAKNKFLPSDEELNPNKKFLENRLFAIILQNKDLQRQFNHYKFSWTEEQDMISVSLTTTSFRGQRNRI
jgi:transcription antitermination protein NusB